MAPSAESGSGNSAEAGALASSPPGYQRMFGVCRVGGGDAAEPAAETAALRRATPYMRVSSITSNIAPCGSAITEKRPTFGMSVGGT